MFGEGLYPVITENFCNGRSGLEVLKEVIKAGVKVVQLREKDMSKNQLYHLAREYRSITKKNQVMLIINDYLDIALAVEADGVHLGQDDLPVKIARKIAPHLTLGVSTHNLEEALKAQKEGATYLNIGPIFPTKTKEIKVKPLGIAALQSIKKELKIPFTVMGGIKENNLKEVVKAGAKRIAMVTEITEAPVILEKIKNLQRIIALA